MKTKKMDFHSKLIEIIKLVNEKIDHLVPVEQSRLSLAMRYSALSSGKRLRPFILIEIADLYNVNRDYSLRTAASIEIVHAYTLIHDDLPAMDNDDFRRGKPSCHKQFDEATAILAGDALLTLAFEILSCNNTHENAEIRCSLVKCLAENIGVLGVAGGQMYDLIYERIEAPNSYDGIVKMHWMKTARLFAASSAMGAILGGQKAEVISKFYKFGELYGLAFQLVDDLADLKQNKIISDNNVLKLISQEQTKVNVVDLIEKAKHEIEFLGASGEILAQLADDLLKEI